VLDHNDGDDKCPAPDQAQVAHYDPHLPSRRPNSPRIRTGYGQAFLLRFVNHVPELREIERIDHRMFRHMSTGTTNSVACRRHWSSHLKGGNRPLAGLRSLRCHHAQQWFARNNTWLAPGRATSRGYNLTSPSSDRTTNSGTTIHAITGLVLDGDSICYTVPVLGSQSFRFHWLFDYSTGRLLREPVESAQADKQRAATSGREKT